MLAIVGEIDRGHAAAPEHAAQFVARRQRSLEVRGNVGHGIQ
jgi:hypothetical protein